MKWFIDSGLLIKTRNGNASTTNIHNGGYNTRADAPPATRPSPTHSLLVVGGSVEEGSSGSCAQRLTEAAGAKATSENKTSDQRTTKS